MYTRQSSELRERGKHEKRKRGVRMDMDSKSPFEDSSLLAEIREAKKFRDDFFHRRMGEPRIR